VKIINTYIVLMGLGAFQQAVAAGGTLISPGLVMGTVGLMLAGLNWKPETEAVAESVVVPASYPAEISSAAGG
jgi:hypothetical protein